MLQMECRDYDSSSSVQKYGKQFRTNAVRKRENKYSGHRFPEVKERWMGKLATGRMRQEFDLKAR